MSIDGMDSWLGERLDKYRGWLDRGEIDYSSKVIPIGESLPPVHWVIPTDQALSLIKDLNPIAVTGCVCRTHYKRCENPVDICLLLGDFAQKMMDKGSARAISLQTAEQVLKKADEHGLVHLSFYRPDRQLFALCSCCACCCHDLQLLLGFRQGGLVAQADYLAVTDPEACLHCGDCVDRCVFKARTMTEGKMVYDPRACYGCGLCVTVCPAGATAMKPRSAP